MTYEPVPEIESIWIAARQFAFCKLLGCARQLRETFLRLAP